MEITFIFSFTGLQTTTLCIITPTCYDVKTRLSTIHSSFSSSSLSSSESDYRTSTKQLCSYQPITSTPSAGISYPREELQPVTATTPGNPHMSVAESGGQHWRAVSALAASVSLQSGARSPIMKCDRTMLGCKHAKQRANEDFALQSDLQWIIVSEHLPLAMCRSGQMIMKLSDES